MGRKGGVPIDVQKFDELCRALNVNAENIERVLGIARRTYHKYRKTGRASESGLVDVFRAASKSAEVAGQARQVRHLCRQMVAGARDQLSAGVAAMFSPTNLPGDDPLPGISAALEGTGGTLDDAFAASTRGDAAEADGLFNKALSEGCDPAEVVVARGHNWLNNGLPDEAVDCFEAGFQARPGDEPLAICVVKAHLMALGGEPVAHLRRAKQLIRTGLGNRLSAMRNYWRMWDVVAYFKTPSRSDKPWAFAAVAEKIAALLPDAVRAGDWPVVGFCRSQGPVALFRSVAPPKDPQRPLPAEIVAMQTTYRRAIGQLQKYVNTLNSEDLTVPRGVSLRNLGNMILNAQTVDTALDRKGARENYRRAVDRYEEACECFLASRVYRQWALTKYSQSSAYLEIAAIYAQPPVDRPAAMRNFDDSEKAAMDALSKLPRRDYPREAAAAAFNVAEGYYHRLTASDDERVEFLQRAVDFYLQSLPANQKKSFKGDYLWTINSLGRTLVVLSELVDGTRVRTINRRYVLELVKVQPRLKGWLRRSSSSAIAVGD